MSSGESVLKVTAPTYARQNFDYRNDVGAEDIFGAADGAGGISSGLPKSGYHLKKR